MMSDTTHALNDTVSLLRAGETFYRDAAERVDHRGLKELFSEMAAIRNAAATEMSQKVEALGGDTSSASWTEQARQFYANAEAMFGGETEALINYLEEHEDRTLEQVRDGLAKAEDHDAIAIFMRHLPIFQQTHDRMKAVKDAQAA